MGIRVEFWTRCKERLDESHRLERQRLAVEARRFARGVQDHGPQNELQAIFVDSKATLRMDIGCRMGNVYGPYYSPYARPISRVAGKIDRSSNGT